MRKCIVIACCESAIFTIGYWVNLMFPSAPHWVWLMVAVTALATAIVVWNWPENRKIAIKEKSPQETGPPDDPGYEVLSYWGESGNPLRDEALWAMGGMLSGKKRYPRMILIKKTGQVKELPYPPVENRIPRSPRPPSE